MENILRLQKIYWVENMDILSSQAILFNSSRNIEDYLIGQPQNLNDFTIDLNHHSKLHHIDLDFFSLLNTVPGKK